MTGLQEGDQFGHYRIAAHIAQGGTGDVYRALDTETGHEVALKIPTRAAILDPRKYEYFLRELEALRVLQNPAVQRQIEAGNYDNTPYLVTELIAGKSLRSVLKHNGPFPPQRAIALTRKIAEGMAYCHAQSVIHCDLKPENVLVTQDDWPVIIDFGLSLTIARPATRKVAGTPDYMAPEQIEGQRPCDQRTDVYALGTTLYEMLTGSAPFTGDDPVEVMNMHLYRAVPRLDRARPDVSPELATIVAKCLQREPDQRYADMHALIDDLDCPEQVDTTRLEALCAAPPKQPFYKNQIVQALLMSFLLMIGIVVLGLLLAALKR